MRVIAGSARGLRLAAPAGMKTRPTADRVKEALFSIIVSRRELIGARILDLCAGTGSLGIEALSRGAASCNFIEHDRHVAGILEGNLARAGLTVRGECLAMDVLKGINLLSKQGKVFDIVFFDPPYQSKLYPLVCEALVAFTLISEHGIVIAESSSRVPLAGNLGGLVRFDRRVYGDTALEFYAREAQ